MQCEVFVLLSKKGSGSTLWSRKDAGIYQSETFWAFFPEHHRPGCLMILLHLYYTEVPLKQFKNYDIHETEVNVL